MKITKNNQFIKLREFAYTLKSKKSQKHFKDENFATEVEVVVWGLRIPRYLIFVSSTYHPEAKTRQASLYSGNNAQPLRSFFFRLRALSSPTLKSLSHVFSYFCGTYSPTTVHWPHRVVILWYFLANSWQEIRLKEHILSKGRTTANKFAGLKHQAPRRFMGRTFIATRNYENKLHVGLNITQTWRHLDSWMGNFSSEGKTLTKIS